jgi:shikimate dehydrogenase
MAISGRTRLAGVMGWPVAHSRSPLLHNAWLARYGIDGAYVPLPVAPGDFADAVRGLRAAGFAGVNVTVPHKEAAFAVCDVVDDSARAAGAVNTLIFGDDAVRGSCSDGAGFLANLAAHGVDVGKGPALVLGAGGAARAIAAALLAAGVAVTVCNRDGARAAALAAALPGLRVLDWTQRDAALGDFSLLVNGTAGGMQSGPALDCDLGCAACGLVVADIVYVPMETALLRDARARGLVAVGGLGMLLHQAVPGFAAWFGVVPVVDAAIMALVSADIPVS